MIDAMLAPLYKWIILALLIFIAGYVLYCNSLAGDLRKAEQICSGRISAAVAPYIAAQDALQEEVKRADEALIEEQQRIKIEFRDIKHETQKIIERDVFRDCRLTPDSLQLAQRANEIANSSSNAGAVR
ncbi:hypothetical protein [Acinetobacter sp.]|uniref:hypothetical protein n=1 Tax=Acinetobacter sp. TaxID=472 RepID=UPI002FC5D085